MEPSAVAVEAAAAPLPSEAVLQGKNALKEVVEGVLYGSVSRQPHRRRLWPMQSRPR